MLTVLGYSINNTIVIMDRIRENTRHSRKETYGEIANNSIWQTMTRSINTTITTLLTIGMVYIIGVSAIKAFALPIIIGIVVGFFSSVFVTGPFWATWRDSAVKAKKLILLRKPELRNLSNICFIITASQFNCDAVF